MLWIPFLASLLACVSDLKRREIPDLLSLPLMAAGLVMAAAGMLPHGPLSALLGIGIAAAIVLPFSMRDGLGGGDLKLLAALGAWSGPWGILHVLFWTALCGMLAAVIARWRGADRFPYAPAIAGGWAVYALWPNLLPALAGFSVASVVP